MAKMKIRRDPFVVVRHDEIGRIVIDPFLIVINNSRLAAWLAKSEGRVVPEYYASVDKRFPAFNVRAFRQLARGSNRDLAALAGLRLRAHRALIELTAEARPSVARAGRLNGCLKRLEKRFWENRSLFESTERLVGLYYGAVRYRI